LTIILVEMAGIEPASSKSIQKPSTNIGRSLGFRIYKQ